MKKRFVSSMLAFVMAFSLPIPAMAVPAEGEKTSTGTVVVDNVPGGAVIAYVDEGDTRMFLPIGEEVELPAGTCINFYPESMYYYEGEYGVENPVFVTTRCDKVTVSTASDAEPGKTYTGTGNGGFPICEYTVEPGANTHIKAAFSGRRNKEDNISVTFEEYVYKTSEEGKNVKIENLELKKYDNGKYEIVEVPFSELEVTGVDFWYADSGINRYESIEPDRFAFDKESGVITWNDTLKEGVYYYRFKAVHEGVTYTASEMAYVGCCNVYHAVVLGFYPYWKNDGRNSRATVNVADYLTTLDGTVDKLEGEMLARLEEKGITGFGMYNYGTFDGWYVNDNWNLVKISDDTQLAWYVTEEEGYGNPHLYARFRNAEGKLYSADIARLDEQSGEVPDPEKPGKPDVPGTDEEIKDAVGELAQIIPAEDASEEDKEEFDAKVKAVADSIENQVKAGREIDPEIIAAMEEVLNRAYGVEVEVEEGYEATGLLLAAGMTSYEATENVAAVRLVEKEKAATVSNADKKSAEKVKFALVAVLDDGKMSRTVVKEFTSLKTPVTLTVPMPDYYIASTSDAERDVVKSGSKELKMVLSEESKSITFTTTELGNFTVGAKADTNSNRRPSGSSSGGGSSSSSRNTGAKGTWQMQDGKWWFKYTDGTYPAGKWEFINSKWYYFDAEGYMETGWQFINGKWYYLDAVNGDMATGWRLDDQDGRWYYLDAVNGDMVVGWKLINEKWYYLNDQVNAVTTWNYNAETSSWEYAGNAVRPFGSMYANETTPDGYQVNADGAWVTD